MRCLRTLAILALPLLLVACSTKEKSAPEKAAPQIKIDEIPAKMDTLKPEMTNDEILQALDATPSDPGIGGGPINQDWELYQLLPGYKLIIIRDEERHLTREVTFKTPTQTFKKILLK